MLHLHRLQDGTGVQNADLQLQGLQDGSGMPHQDGLRNDLPQRVLHQDDQGRQVP